MCKFLGGNAPSKVVAQIKLTLLCSLASNHFVFLFPHARSPTLELVLTSASKIFPFIRVYV